MKNILALLILFSGSICAQYTVTSPYLIQPEKAIPYVDSCARFWFNAYDPVYGGYYTNIDRQGNLIASWGKNKNTLSQSRDAYGFVRAFMLTGDTVFLTRAQQALNFMYAKAWDNTNGGYWNDINENGTVVSTTANKTAFYQHYALLGITAMYEATRSTDAFLRLFQVYNNNEAKLWDPNPATFGYYDNVSYNWSTKTGKSFNATVDAITTHLLHLYMMTQGSAFKTRLLQMGDNMMNRLTSSMNSQAIGFAEIYDNNWNINSSETMTIMGHVLKTAWCFARLHTLFPDTTYITAAKKLVQNVLDKGYDNVYGGPYKDYNRVTGQMLMWNNPDTAKAWWQIEQGVTGGLMMYKVTGDSKYLKMADESLNFFMNYFVDHTYGEVYENRTRRGASTWGDHKGNSGKAAYHSTETGYYVYLYGKLLLQRQPAKLYYKFDAENQERICRVAPISGLPGEIRISSVTKDGAPYSNYSATEATVTVPAGTKGIFVVTFEPGQPLFVDKEIIRSNELLKVSANYPNPFATVTSVKISLLRDGEVSFTLREITGREVYTQSFGKQPAGERTLLIDLTEVKPASGIYIGEITTGNAVQRMKMVVVK